MIDTLDIYRIVDGSPVLITSIASDEAVLGNVIMGKNEIAVSLVTEVILDIKEG